MAYFEFPHARTYDSDLGWLIWAMKKLIGDWENFSNTNSIKFADPLNWSIATNYEPSTIVVDADGNGYISRQAVPVGVPLSNDDYWTQIFSFGDITDTIRANIAYNIEESPTLTEAVTKDQLIWWNDNLYIALYAMQAGTALIEGTNVNRFTVDQKIDLIRSTLQLLVEEETAAREAADQAETEAREAADQAETEAREEEDTRINGLLNDLSNVTATHFETLEDSIDTRFENLQVFFVDPCDFGAVGDGVTNDAAAVQAAGNAGVIRNTEKTFYIGNSITINHGADHTDFLIGADNGIIFEGNNIHIHGCNFHNDAFSGPDSRGQWMVIIDQCEDPVISDNLFYHGNSCVYLNRVKRGIVTGNVFKDIRQTEFSGGNGYGILTIANQDIEISNNIFYNVARHEIYLSQESDGSAGVNKNIMISGNVFKRDAACVGNTTGLEVSINIRPSEYVYIENNSFDGEFAIINTNAQLTQEGGTANYRSSNHIYITNNRGVFRNDIRPNQDGIIMLSGTAFEGTVYCPEFVYIKGNIIEAQHGNFIRASAFSNVYIEHNNITFNSEYRDATCLFRLIYPTNPVKAANLYIINNQTRGEFRRVASLEPGANIEAEYGVVIIEQNSAAIEVPMFAHAGGHFVSLRIAYNKFNERTDRIYLNSCGIDYLSLKENLFNNANIVFNGVPAHVKQVDNAITITGHGTPADAAWADCLNGESWAVGNTFWIKTSDGWKTAAIS